MIEVKLFVPQKIDVAISFPETWDELLPDEILLIAKQILLVKEDNTAKAELLVSILSSRAKTQKQKLPKKWQQLLSIDDLVINGLPLLDFIYGENTLSQMPESVIKVIGTREYVLYAPVDGFRNITCGEFEIAEQVFAEYNQEQNINKLAELAAIFYRPKNTSFQTREKNSLNTYPYDKWAKMFKSIEPHRLYAIFIWYVGCKNQLPLLFPVSHEPSNDDNEDTQNPAMAFTRCIHAGAGPKNGTRQDIRLTLLWEFFFDMEQNAIAAKKQLNDLNK